jgi:RNA-directed DNA polymerase
VKLSEVLVSASKPSWDELTDATALEALFNRKFAQASVGGRDRITASAFASRVREECHIIERKARSDSYQFSAYLERLVTKGRAKEPRVLSIPSLRDRIVLNQLKEFLHAHIPRVVRRGLPNEYVRDIKEKLSSRATEQLSFVRADIKSFYDSI